MKAVKIEWFKTTEATPEQEIPSGNYCYRVIFNDTTDVLLGNVDPEDVLVHEDGSIVLVDEEDFVDGLKFCLFLQTPSSYDQSEEDKEELGLELVSSTNVAYELV